MQLNNNQQCVSHIDINIVKLVSSSKKTHKPKTRVLMKDHKNLYTKYNFDKGTSYNHSFTGVIANKDRLPAANKLSLDIV